MLKSYDSGKAGSLLDLEWTPTSFVSNSKNYLDNRRIAFNVTMNSDMDFWLDWERQDNYQQAWYI